MRSLFLLCFMASIWMSCQTTIPAQAAPKTNFPTDWYGKWVGQLYIYNAKGLSMEIRNQLEIRPTDTAGVYKWVITYGVGSKADVRDYRLLPRDTSRGIWVIDEKNTIVIEAYLTGNRFTSWFEVGGSVLLCTYELRGREMLVEIYAANAKPASITGGTIVGTDTIPAVKTFPMQVYQRSVMTRK